jgi:hypothetical protein
MTDISTEEADALRKIKSKNRVPFTYPASSTTPPDVSNSDPNPESDYTRYVWYGVCVVGMISVGIGIILRYFSGPSSR